MILVFWELFSCKVKNAVRKLSVPVNRLPSDRRYFFDCFRILALLIFLPQLIKEALNRLTQPWQFQALQQWVPGGSSSGRSSGKGAGIDYIHSVCNLSSQNNFYEI